MLTTLLALYLTGVLIEGVRVIWVTPASDAPVFHLLLAMVAGLLWVRHFRNLRRPS
ncbi:MAG: hypothetical protein WBF53_05100 [Litorimonas sp.]